MILEKLKKALQGEVLLDTMSRHIYSVDASIYEVVPQAVVLPRNLNDLIATVEIAAEYGIPLIPRGGATGIAGGCIGDGIVIDTSKYMNTLLEIDEESALVEPGLVVDILNAAAEPFGRKLGPDISTGNRATLGGMVATNAVGSYYLRDGNMLDHVEEVEMLTCDGCLHALNKSYLGLEPFKKKYGEAIATSFPKFHRRSTGYSLDHLDDPAKLVVGSEGSLGLFTKIRVRLSCKPKTTSLALIPFSSIEESLAKVAHILTFHPIALELLDANIISLGRLRGKLDWLMGTPPALLIAAFESPQPPSLGLEEIPILDLAVQKQVWTLRKAGLGLLLSRRSYARAVAFLEDIAVPPENVLPFYKAFQALLAKHKMEAGVYGHVGDACLHIRPFLDLRKLEVFNSIFTLMEEAVPLIEHFGGVLSGEHGDGIIRSWLNPRLPLYDALCDLKKHFDPLGIMNPGKVVAPLNPKENLRLSPKSAIISIPTFLNFEKEGGFSLAVDLCNGNGECRKTSTLMCPSYHGENNEKMTTRARAQALRSIVHGKLPLNELTGDALHEVLDYCLECKGCKRECPSSVDMAKMKVEVLHRRHEVHGIPLKTRLLAGLTRLYPMAHLLPLNSPLLKRLFSLTPERPFPALAKQRFSKQWTKRPSAGRQVLLFIDTFTEFHHPEVGLAAATLLERAGFEVLSFPWKCCGRPLFSQGLLHRAQQQAHSLLDHLDPILAAKIPIVTLEPSCLSMFQEDYASLLNDPRVDKLIASSYDLASFLLPRNLPWKEHNYEVLYHGHCHEKALQGTGTMLQWLRSSGLKVHEIPSGCCGLAGSFGYEAKHYPLSMQIGEHVLFPAVRQRGKALIVANGFSCRHQILQGTGILPEHPATLLASLAKNP